MKQKCQCPERASEREEGKRGGGGILNYSPGGWRHGIVGMHDGNDGRIFEFTLPYRCNIVE